MCMSSYRALLIGVLCVCIVLTGCHMSTEPRTVARWTPGDRPELKEARYWGEYRLYALEKGQRNPPAGAEPVATVRLAEDEKFGFGRDANGYVVATAADQTFATEKRTYVWQMKPDDAQPDKNRRNLAVFSVFVVVAVLIAVGIATADPFN
jgi:hypothetical protein